DGIRDFHVTGVQTCALPISEPQHLFCDLRTFAGHALEKGRLATRTPQLGGLTAEVEHRQLAFRVELAEVAPLARAAPSGLAGAGMEGRVAQGQVDAIIRLQ